MNNTLMEELITIDGHTFRRKQNSSDHRERNYYKIISKCKNHNLHLHQYLWESHNKTKIPKGYCVHHADFNPLNNSINNLILMTRSEHTKIHKIEEWKHKEIKTRTCVRCGSSFKTRSSQNKEQHCSRKCREDESRKEVKCKFCNKITLKRKDSRAVFCDVDCSLEYKRWKKK